MQLCNFAIFVSESIYFHKALQEQADKKLQFLPEGEFVAFMKVVQQPVFRICADEGRGACGKTAVYTDRKGGS